MRAYIDPLTPTCPGCGGRHYPATVGNARRWCKGKPATGASRIPPSPVLDPMALARLVGEIVVTTDRRTKRIAEAIVDKHVRASFDREADRSNMLWEAGSFSLIACRGPFAEIAADSLAVSLPGEGLRAIGGIRLTHPEEGTVAWTITEPDD